MTEHNDQYREWDAAYVLGALSADEHQEFERHLAGCDQCANAVTELAAIPGRLAAVPPDDAVVSIAEPSVPQDPSEDTFPQLVAAARAESRRTRRRVVAGSTALSALAAGLAVAVFGLVGAERSETSGEPAGPAAIELAETASAPISATVRLEAQPWGTDIEGECHYEPASGDGGLSRYGSGGLVEYAMYATDVDGAAHRIATWTASPGMTITPRATVGLPRDQIASVDIRSVDPSRVLLVRDVT